MFSQVSACPKGWVGMPGPRSLLCKGMSRGGRYARECTGGVLEEGGIPGVGIPEDGGRDGYVHTSSTWDLRYPPLPLVLTPSGSHHNTYSCKWAVCILLECCIVLLNRFCSRSIFPNSEKIKNCWLKMKIYPWQPPALTNHTNPLRRSSVKARK